LRGRWSEDFIVAVTVKQHQVGTAMREFERIHKAMKTGFVPISLKEYVKLHLKSNPGTSRQEVVEVIEDTLRAYEQGARCEHCGNPIWVIGSAFSGFDGCFTCITGEAYPEDDYEIDEACG
jgi:hypothetical protein